MYLKISELRLLLILDYFLVVLVFLLDHPKVVSEHASNHFHGLLFPEDIAAIHHWKIQPLQCNNLFEKVL